MSFTPSASPSEGWPASRNSQCERRLERETGIEPATNSLEGCDSTTELLPPSRFRAPLTLTAELVTAILVLRFPRSNPNLTGGQWAANRNAPEGCARKLVGREGLEPSNPPGR